MITGLPTPFCTVAYADGVIGAVAPWSGANQAHKESSLQYSRVYITDTYYCNFDLDDAPESVQTASALLANLHLTSDIFLAQDKNKPAQGLTQNAVDAKGVKASKSWDPSVAKQWKDPFPRITAILATDGYCTLNKDGARVVALVRR